MFNILVTKEIKKHKIVSLVDQIFFNFCNKLELFG